MTMGDTSQCFGFYILLISCWAVAASLEETNAGVTVFVADITSMCGFRSDVIAALLSVCSLVRCCSQQFIVPCLEMLFQFRPLLHFVQSATRPSHDIVSMLTAFASLTQRSLYNIAGEGGWRAKGWLNRKPGVSGSSP